MNRRAAKLKKSTGVGNTSKKNGCQCENCRNYENKNIHEIQQPKSFKGWTSRISWSTLWCWVLFEVSREVAKWWRG